MKSLGLALLLGISLLVPAGATAAEEPDTTPPQVALDPCPGTPVDAVCAQRQFAVVYGWLGDGDDLAAITVSVDGVVTDERVYDDGSGFVPYGEFSAPGSDVIEPVDYAAVAQVPPGIHEVVLTARDLAGNQTSVTRTIEGAEVPGRVPGLHVSRSRPHLVRLAWHEADPRGAYIQAYVVRVRGTEPLVLSGGPPSSPATDVALRGLEPGRQVVRIFAVNGVGRGEAKSFVFRVPQPHRAR